MHFAALCERCPIKLIDFATLDVRDPHTLANNTTVVCYLETEHAWCDSGDAICFTKDAAREEAARRFLELLQTHNFDDKQLNNLSTRSLSPACTSGRATTDKQVRSTLLDPHEIPVRRVKSTSPRFGRERSATVGSDMERSRSVIGSIKSIFRGKKAKKKK